MPPDSLQVSPSGVGFFGQGGHGASIPVSQYNRTTFVTDGNGVNQGPTITNTRFLNSASGVPGSASSGIALTAIPNRESTLNIRFTHTSAIKTQNAKLRIYDRSVINNPASGVTTKVAEIIHPTLAQTNNGSGDSVWAQPTGSSVIMDFVASPGDSGIRPNGASTTSKRHDWFAVLSASPDSIGSKTLYGLYFELEYLTLFIAAGLSCFMI